MSITKYPPNTVLLAGGPQPTIVNDIVASEAITPGMLIERFSDSGTPKFRKNATSGANGSTYAIEQSMLNRGVDDAYAAGDLVEAFVGKAGDTVWALVPSGTNVQAGAKMQADGAGLLIAVGAGLVIARALEDTDNSAGPANMRCKVEIV